MVAAFMAVTALDGPRASDAPVPKQANAQAAAADARRVGTFLDRAIPVCRQQSSYACVDAGWNFAAKSPDKGLSVADLQVLRQQVGAWYDANHAGMRARDRSAFGLGLMLADGLGPQRLHASFDTDSNGWVSRKELLADVTLDERPIGKVMADPGAVDRQGLARRIGLPPALVEKLFQ